MNIEQSFTKNSINCDTNEIVFYTYLFVQIINKNGSISADPQYSLDAILSHA